MSFDLSFERFVDASARHLYDGWTRPELLVQWFTPAPWRT
ncbi:MAG: polyketide cyclase, partial [Actinobacteria bacterium]|nr:polyketide cyclase [Actinomycetota bacterium]